MTTGPPVPGAERVRDTTSSACSCEDRFVHFGRDLYILAVELYILAVSCHSPSPHGDRVGALAQARRRYHKGKTAT